MGFVLASLIVSAPPLIAQSATADELQRVQAEQQRIIQEEQLRQQELLKDRDSRRQLPKAMDIDEQPEASEGVSSQCFDIATIVLDGTTHLSEQERASLVAPFLGSCMGLVEIRELMRAVTNLYIDKGYITTKAYIPQQDLNSGTLTLLVVEGVLGKIELDTDDSTLNLSTAFPGLEGEILNLRDIEQGLDQLNRLQSNNATMELRPDSVPGKTSIAISNSPSKPYSGSFTLDDYGSDSTGKYRATLSAGLDNALTLNDFWFMSLSQNTDADNDTRLSRSSLINFNLPYGYWNLTGSYSESEYRSLVQSASQSYLSSGFTETFNLGLQTVLARSHSHKLTLTLGLSHKNQRNYILNSLLISGSPKLTVWNANLTSVFSAAGGTWNMDVGFHRGVGAFDVEDLPNAGRDLVPEAHASRTTFSATYSKPVRLATLRGSWSSSLQAQYTQDNLYGSEQISVGGLYTVRGYDGVSVSGGRGAYWRNDWSWQVADAVTGEWSAWLGRWQPYLAFDAGFIDPRKGEPGGRMIGSALGLRTRGGLINLDLAFSVPVSYSDRIEDTQDVDDYAAYAKFAIPF